MSPWTGRMKTALLTDQRIRPTEYRRWDDAVRRFERRDKDRELVEKLKASIEKDGLSEPITLGIDDRYHDVYVADGHHRAVALMAVGAKEFAFHWYWIRSFGVSIEREPFPWHVVGL